MMIFDEIEIGSYTFDPNGFDQLNDVSLQVNVDALRELSDEELLEEAKRFRNQILNQTKDR